MLEAMQQQLPPFLFGLVTGCKTVLIQHVGITPVLYGCCRQVKFVVMTWMLSSDTKC